MSLAEQVVAQAVQRYWREYDRYAKLAEFVAERCRAGIVEENAIRATVSWRAKAPKKLDGKLRKYLQDPAEAAQIATVDSVFSRIGDLAGVRISTYEERDRIKVVEEIQKLFGGPSDGSANVEKMDKDGRFYRATHCQVMLTDDDLIGRYENLTGLSAEIQVCSLLAHVWNEIEHDLSYKPTTGELSEREVELLKMLGHLTVTGDLGIKHLFEATDERLSEQTGTFQDVYDFVARMRGDFPSAEYFSANAGQLFDELVALGLDTPEKIRDVLLDDRYEDRSDELLIQLKEYYDATGYDANELHDPTSDQLLMLLLDKRVDAVVNNHPMGRGRGRPSRLASVASRFQKMREQQELDAAGEQFLDEISQQGGDADETRKI